jgi:NADPH:quinone reductase-like Zn-dependent oxidoreductase
VRTAGFMAEPSAADLGAIAELITQGRVRPVVQATYPLAEVAEAHRQLEHGHVRGKLVLTVG